MKGGALLSRACALHGVEPDGDGRVLLEVLGLPAGDDAALGRAVRERERRDWGRVLVPLHVHHLADGAPAVPVHLPARSLDAPLAWRLLREDGLREEGRCVPAQLRETARALGHVRVLLPLPELPVGYHHLELRDAQGAWLAVATLAVAPERCHRPESLATSGPVWGLAAPLARVRSGRNWGIGDLTDLRGLLELAARLGAGFVDPGPLHPLAAGGGACARGAIDPLLIDVEAVPELVECVEVRERVTAPAFQARLRALRGAVVPERDAVWAAKCEVLEALFEHFQAHRDGSARGDAFHAWSERAGAGPRRFAVFQTLHEHLAGAGAPPGGDWKAWPARWRDRGADTPLPAELDARAAFHEYLQWLAEEQLAAAGERALAFGMTLGLCTTVAAGAAPAGADAWAEHDAGGLLLAGTTPPARVSLPARLHDTGWADCREALRHAMRHAGAVRLRDLGALRGGACVTAAGTPVRLRMPERDLLGLVALESWRSRCLVVADGNDDGPQSLTRRGMLVARMVLGEGAAVAAPAEFPEQAFVALRETDAPDLCTFWRGADIDRAVTAGRLADAAAHDARVTARATARARLLLALEHAGLLPEDAAVHPVAVPAVTPALVGAVYAWLGASPALLAVVHAGDALCCDASETGALEAASLPLNIEAWPADEGMAAVCAALRAARPGARAAAPPPPEPAVGRLRIPRATYRLQLHRGFGFAAAAALVPYLDALGVSHCYLSPCLRARAGSGHGYDVTEHGELNPELGGREGHRALSEALRGRGMGQLLDIVPNHMGVMGADNAWWLDLLENGQAAEHEPFFDVDWQPPRARMAGRVLVPVLGHQYGEALEGGEIGLRFDAAQGSISAWYYEHRFPLDPRSYPRVFTPRLPLLEASLADGDPLLAAFQSLLDALARLPARDVADEAARAVRTRDKELHKQRLASLYARSPDLARFVDDCVREMNGTPGDPLSFDRLHELLEAQAWRLAFWRVATDEINYRRFFDVNELAALRAEREDVFEATHRLALALVREGEVEGLRIDHPDGLYDPAGYFARLQARCAPAAAGDAPGFYVLVEKILAHHERLPESWPVHGTTGYDFLNALTGLLVHAPAARLMQRIYAGFSGQHRGFDELLHEAKRLVMRVALASEVNVLAGQLDRVAQMDRHTADFTRNALREALIEVIACFPVYRTYVADGAATEEDRRHVEWAVSVAAARSRAGEHSVYEFLRGVLLGEAAAGAPAARREAVNGLAMKFQQVTAPVMAKGMEDTACYLYNRLICLNEVGGDPRRFGLSVGAFHQQNVERAARWPHAMLCTSTHDTKRSEDVRARIAVLSEIGEEWRRRLARWNRVNRYRRGIVDGRPAPSRNDEYLLYQTLIGAWPPGEPDATALEDFRRRIQDYMRKAMREAKLETSWLYPRPEYEEAVARFIDRLFERPARNPFLADFVPFQRRVARFGAFNGLVQTLLKLTCPGMPDIYQGTELWEFSLVDPDNRRPVDYARRAALLAELGERLEREGAETLAGALAADPCDDRAKLYLVWRTLALRRALHALFDHGSYRPLVVTGRRAEHLCAFARECEVSQVLVLAPRWHAALLEHHEERPLGERVWGDTAVAVPSGEGARYRDALSGAQLSLPGDGHGALAVAAALRVFPVALLERVPARSAAG